MKTLFQNQSNGTFQLPASFVPQYDPNIKCPHNNHFDDNDQNLILKFRSVTIYSESTETIKDISVYARPTIGNGQHCNCMDQPDTTDVLLWNLGNSKFIQLNYVLTALHNLFHGQGISVTAGSRASNFSVTLGCSTTLTDKLLEKAVIGLYIK